MKEIKIISVSAIKISYLKSAHKHLAGFTITYSDRSMKNVVREITSPEDEERIIEKLSLEARKYKSKLAKGE